ncbi:MAG TPA: molybdopterin-dependent oxidoreductase [Blastocatellia bacterium]|nr:molybdopterin-dependent oxidoreductase [Blastocatellia bacterium]
MKRSFNFSVFLIFGTLLLVRQSPAGSVSQERQPNGTQTDPLLTVSAEPGRSLKLSLGDLARLPRRTTRAKEHSGKDATFEGVALLDILKLVGVKFGEGLRGKALSQYVVVKATDNYQVVFALPELDPAFTDRMVLLADKKNGSRLAASEGPFRVVVPDEKRQARWVRNVISISVARVQ